MIEDIEMELVKIHGGDDDEDDDEEEKSGDFKDDPDDELEDSNQTYHGFSTDMVDTGTMDHSSDEDYAQDSYISHENFIERGLGLYHHTTVFCFVFYKQHFHSFV